MVVHPETKAAVFRVSLENIADLWPHVEDLVKSDLILMPTHTPDDVRRILLANQAHLWIQWSGRVEAMAVTDFCNFPQGMSLRVWLGAARKDAQTDREQFYTELSRWARRNECKWIDACGRAGWMRVFPDAKCQGLFMRITVDKEHA